MKVLIANRGEIAVRIARTCKSLGIKTVSIFSEADKNSMHTKVTDESFGIGGFLPKESYLIMEKVIEAAEKTRCDSVHPGYGFLSENSEFSRLCRKKGLLFVGPPETAMELSGDKVRAREAASKIAPILEGKEVSKGSDAIRFAGKLGYPVILKAVEGGGGRGLRIVRSAEEMESSFQSSRSESLVSFNSNRVYVEKYLESPRHIEVQVLSGEDTVHLGERECSVQRRHQKLIEETPSPGLSVRERAEITKSAVGIMDSIGYENAGTVEFLLKDGKFYFMEINARIQVEHPITEMVTGIDIVEQQLNIAAGNFSLRQRDIALKGHAMECRINAEHPLTFTPSPGTIDTFLMPSGPGIRVDTALFSGYTIPQFYDSLVAKLICHGKNREESVENMRRALLDFRISGIPTTVPFHLSALSDKRFLRGDYDTSFVSGMNSVSDADGEVAAAIFSQIPVMTKFIGAGNDDPWSRSRFWWSG